MSATTSSLISLAAMAFVNQVAEKAEKAGHHPDIDIRYNKVRLALVSHDKGGLTERDMKMAQAIDSIVVVDLQGPRIQSILGQAGPSGSRLCGAFGPGFCDSRWRRRFLREPPRWRATGRCARNSCAPGRLGSAWWLVYAVLGGNLRKGTGT